MQTDPGGLETWFQNPIPGLTRWLSDFGNSRSRDGFLWDYPSQPEHAVRIALTLFERILRKFLTCSHVRQSLIGLMKPTIAIAPMGAALHHSPDQSSALQLGTSRAKNPRHL